MRRYKPPTLPPGPQSDAWTVPDDRKVNPWDLNEPDPTDNGTMGTIPGPVIECNVGDEVIVHFRNMDMRTHPVTKQVCFDFPFPICFPITTEEPIEIEKRIHSLHPHGFVFAAASDGAFPLSPPDSAQPVTGILDDESFAWSKVPGFSGILKKGDRVPPGGSFIYTWKTNSWPTTAGVWHYHDHSICDTENVNLGAIGIIVIHNPADTAQEVDIRDPNDPSGLDPAFLPGGSPNGFPTEFFCFPVGPLPVPRFPFPEIRALPHDLDGLGAHDEIPHRHGMAAATAQPEKKSGSAPPCEPEFPILARTIRRGDMLLELDEKLQFIKSFCFSFYRTPPAKALYLQLFHTLTGGKGMDGGQAQMINGRTFMGNTPTMVAGPNTRMRFGVVGMGDDFHVFHLHGHRWIIPGPDGITPTDIQNSPMVQAVTQFEDTKMFGPANSFVFTIDEGNGFMRASPPIGEWHMHCHVLGHMMMGMMGSLLVVNGGEIFFALPVGVPCDMPKMGGGGGTATHQVSIDNVGDDGFLPKVLNVNAGDTVTWKNND
ncbi:MAG: multicopper oxidase domain-containing protein, partial [Methylocella sp.]